VGTMDAMASGGFLSMASVVAILSGVALAVVLSAPILAPLARFGRRRATAFAVCLVVIWALAALVITLIRRTI
jgi:uncharacterized membrane protein